MNYRPQASIVFSGFIALCRFYFIKLVVFFLFYCMFMIVKNILSTLCIKIMGIKSFKKIIDMCFSYFQILKSLLIFAWPKSYQHFHHRIQTLLK